MRYFCPLPFSHTARCRTRGVRRVPRGCLRARRTVWWSRRTRLQARSSAALYELLRPRLCQPAHRHRWRYRSLATAHSHWTSMGRSPQQTRRWSTIWCSRHAWLAPTSRSTPHGHSCTEAWFNSLAVGHLGSRAELGPLGLRSASLELLRVQCLELFRGAVNISGFTALGLSQVLR